MRVRPATQEDVPDIARVHIASWITTYRDLVPAAVLESLSVAQREEQWARQMDVVLDNPQRGCAFVAEDAAAGIVGLASGGPERESAAPYDGELYTLYLLATHQRLGAGRELFSRVATHLAKHGYASMRAWVLESNPARSFYERLGGEPAGEKRLSLGGETFHEVAYGWRDLGPTAG